MRVTTKTNIGLRALMFCAVNPDRTVQKAQIAEACNASGNHLAQVIHILGREGFVATQRGRGGGLRLGRPASEITIGAVFRALEAKTPFAECFSNDRNTCPLVEGCRLRGAFAKALAVFYAELDKVTLDDLVCDNAQLDAILSLEAAAPAACPAAG